MSNQDLLDRAVQQGNHLEAAKLAIQFAAGKGSRSGCWAWSDQAVAQAAKAGVALEPGRESWPNLAGMEAQLK